MTGKLTSDLTDLHKHVQNLISSSPFCLSRSSCNEVPETSQTDSEDACSKTIKSSLRRTGVGGQVTFCLANSVGSWCHDSIYQLPLLQQKSTGSEIDFTLQNHSIKLCCF